jgi:alpha-galactosidase
MRIGADVDGRWNPAILGKDIPIFYNEPGLPSARNAIQNTLSRASLHRRWWINDPDCLLLRETTQLSLDEIQSLATVIALSGGLLVLSDHLPELPVERLAIAQALLPTIGQRPQVLDWFDAGMPQRIRLDLSSSSETWHLLALHNWQGQEKEFDFSLQDYNVKTERSHWLRDFWENETHILEKNESIKISIPSHGVRLFAVRAVDENSPVYLGSNLHISQGLEITQKVWQDAEGMLTLTIERPGEASGMIELSLPRAPLSASLDGQPLEWVLTPSNSYQFSIEFTRQTHIRIQCTENSKR